MSSSSAKVGQGTAKYPSATSVTSPAQQKAANRQFDKAMDVPAQKVAKSTPSMDVSGASGEQHGGVVNGVSVSAGPYQGAKQVEMTIPGQKNGSLHLIGNYGQEGNRSFGADFLPQKGEGLGFTFQPGGQLQWHTTDGLNDQPISTAQASNVLLKEGFLPNGPLKGTAKDIFGGLMTAAGPEASSALNQLAPTLTIQPSKLAREIDSFSAR